MYAIVADCHEMIADALAYYITNTRPGIEVKTATNFDHVLELLSDTTEFDLAILDKNLSGMNGLEGLKALRTRFPDLPIVILSETTSALPAREAISCGAAGFFPKQLCGKVLLAALELVLSGGTFVPTIALSEDGAKESFGTHGPTGHSGANNPPLDLTRRERAVLSLLVNGLSNKAIAQELGVTASTAAFHVKSVFRKLGVRNRAEAVAAAFRSGLDAT